MQATATELTWHTASTRSPAEPRKTDEVAAAIRSRDLSKKGAEHRQQDYVERTIRKARTYLEPSHAR